MFEVTLLVEFEMLFKTDIVLKSYANQLSKLELNEHIRYRFSATQFKHAIYKHGVM